MQHQFTYGTGAYLASICKVSELHTVWDDPTIVLTLGALRAALTRYMDRMGARGATYKPLGALISASYLSHLLRDKFQSKGHK